MKKNKKLSSVKKAISDGLKKETQQSKINRLEDKIKELEIIVEGISKGLETVVENNNVKVGLFGVRYFYINPEKRVRYGYSFKNLGVCYKLQYKGSIFWKDVSWTYADTYYDKSLAYILTYLEWHHLESLKTKCKF